MTNEIPKEVYIYIGLIKGSFASWLIRLSKEPCPINLESLMFDMHFTLLPHFNDGIGDNIVRRFDSLEDVFYFLEKLINNYKKQIEECNIDIHTFFANMVNFTMQELSAAIITSNTLKSSGQITIN